MPPKGENRTGAPVLSPRSQALKEEHDDEAGDAGKADEIYQRIMRKLQRQANYKEMSSQPLRYEVGPPSNGNGGNHNNEARALSPSKAAQLQQLEEKTSTLSLYDQMHEADEEKNFGTFPCPPTLRAVLEYVLQTMTEKLEVAHLGSLKDCMKNAFECRTLMDKLLKEIPTYHHFGEHAVATNHARVQELYQEFRKNPVTLPQAKYVESDKTGQFLPELNFGAKSGALGGIRAVSPRSGGAGRVPQPPMHSFGTVATLTRVASHMLMNQKQSHNRNQFTAIAGHQTAYHNKDHELLMRHLRRQTQSLNIGIQTMENSYTMVSKAQYEEIGDQVQQLIGVISERDYVIEHMKAKQCAALGVINNKATTVQYLRQTLYKECCILRQQLTMAHQKVQSLQVQLEAMTKGGGGTTYGGGPRDKSDGSTHIISLGEQEAHLAQVHSLIDLALLAVEKDKIIAPSGELHANSNSVIANLKEQMHIRQMRWKRDLVNMRGKFVLVLEEKNKQMKSVALSSDVVHMRSVISEKIMDLRRDFAKNKFAVRELLAEMRHSLGSFTSELRSAVLDVEDRIQEGKTAAVERAASKQLVEVAASQLLLPMLCESYCYSTHNFLVRHRMTDPLTHYLQHTLPSQEVCIAMRQDCEFLQHLYGVIHHFVLIHCRLPEQTKPNYGPDMKKVAFGLYHNALTTHEAVQSIRQILETDAEMSTRLAKINFQIKSVSHTQTSFHKRSEQSFVEAGFETSTHMLPVLPLLNRLGGAISKLHQTKADLVKDRMHNCKELYKIWVDSGVSVDKGKKRPPAKNPNIMISGAVAASVVSAFGGGGKGAVFGDFAVAKPSNPKWAAAVKATKV